MQDLQIIAEKTSAQYNVQKYYWSHVPEEVYTKTLKRQSCANSTT